MVATKANWGISTFKMYSMFLFCVLFSSSSVAPLKVPPLPLLSFFRFPCPGGMGFFLFLPLPPALVITFPTQRCQKYTAMIILLFPGGNADKGHLYQNLCSSYKHESLVLHSSCILWGQWLFGVVNIEIGFLLFLQTQNVISLGKSHTSTRYPLSQKGIAG